MSAIWHAHVLPRLNSALAHLGYRFFPLNFDYLLQALLLKRGAKEFFFIQVGAFDGISQDAFTRYIEQFQIRGVLLEPQTVPFSRLTENYRHLPRLTLLNAAVADQPGSRDFYTVRPGVPGMPEWSQQLASFDKANILKHRDGIPEHGIAGIKNIEEHIEVRSVACVTFNQVLDGAGAQTLDVLQIDAEGYDVDLVDAFPFDRLKPGMIRYEHMHISRSRQAACLQRLKALGYRFVFETADTVAYLPGRIF